MQREDKSSQERTTQGEPAQQDGQQAGGGGVPQDINQVVAEGGVTPDRVLDPKGRMQQRIVLLRGSDLEPDAKEPRPGLQIGSRDMTFIVPEQLPGQSGVVGGQAGDQQEEKHQADGPGPRVGGRYSNRRRGDGTIRSHLRGDAANQSRPVRSSLLRTVGVGGGAKPIPRGLSEATSNGRSYRGTLNAQFFCVRTDL